MSDMPADPTRDTRSEILDAFAAELCGGGYLGASLDAVAKRAGIKKASLYHHFPGGKEEMFRETALRYIERQAGHVAAAIDPATPVEDQLVRLAVLGADPPESNPELDQQVYDGTRHISDELRTEVSTAYVEGLTGPVVAIMQRAVDAGEVLGDASFLAWSFLGMASALAPIPDDVAMPPQHRGPRPEIGAQARAMVSLFLEGARPR